MNYKVLLIALLSLLSIASYGQLKPITGLTIDQKKELVRYKLGFEYQELDIINYRAQLENCSKINLSLTEIERLRNEQIIELKEIIELQKLKITTYQNRLEIRTKPRTNWLMIILGFIAGIGSGYLVFSL